MPSREKVDFLASSQTRLCLLRELDDQQLTPSTLTETCACSRATVHRNVETLQKYGWVRSVDGRYELTVVGKRILREFHSLLETTSCVDTHSHFFDYIGDLGLDIPLSGFETGTVVTATPGNPHAPVRHFRKTLEELSSEHFYGISPIVSPEFNEASRSFIDAGTQTELIIDETVLDTSRSIYKSAFADALNDDNFSLLVSPDDLSFGLAVFDDRALVGAYSESGQLQACLESRDDELVKWATKRYNEHHRRATAIEVILSRE